MAFSFNRIAVIVVVGLAASVPLRAANIASSRTGNWSDPGMWAGGVAPSSGDVVTITAGHIVTVDITTVVSGAMDIFGELRFSRAVNSRLEMSGGSMIVRSGGRLDMGNGSSPIPAGVRAELILALGATPGQYGLEVQDGGRFWTHGAEKSCAAWATGNALVGGNSFNVNVASTTGWETGDVIALSKSNRSSFDETEVFTIADLTGGAVSVGPWNGGVATFQYDHRSTGPFVAANLTRNVLVRSSGTDVNANTAYVSIQTDDEGYTDLRYAEFAYLGTRDDVNYRKNGLSTRGTQARLYMKGVSIRHGHDGLYINGGDKSRVEETISAFCSRDGFRLQSFANSNSFLRVMSIANNTGFRVFGDCQETVITEAFVLDNAVNGFHFEGGGRAVVRKSLSHANNNVGIHIFDFQDSVVLNSTCSANGGKGIRIENSQNIITNQLNSFENGSSGIYDAGSSNIIHLHDVAFSNLDSGIDIEDSSVALWGARLGLTRDLSAAPNGTRGLLVTASSATIRAVDLVADQNPPWLSSDIQAGTSLISIGHQDSPGTIVAVGDVRNAPQTMAFQSNVLESTSSSIIRFVEQWPTANVTVDSVSSGLEFSEVVSIEYDENLSAWRVEGSSSGALGQFAGSITNTPFPSGDPLFTMTFSQTSAPKDGDIIVFALISGSRDASVQKRLLFAPADVSFNGGRSRLAIPSGGVLALEGTSADPALIDTIDGTGSYTLVSSGSFSAAHARFNNIDTQGLQLSGNEGVSLSSCTFDNIGVQAGQPSAYITPRDLTSSATFHNLGFLLSRSTAGASSAHNVRVVGNDAGLNWTLSLASGAFAGAHYESDANRRIRWIETVPPGATSDLAAQAGASYGQAVLTWTSAGDNGADDPLEIGAYLIAYSTDAAALAGATTSQADVIAATDTAQGSAQSVAIDGLFVGASTYFRLWTRDGSGNVSAMSNEAEATAHRDPPEPPSLSAQIANAAQAVLNWTPPAIPPDGYVQAYAISYSSASAAGPYHELVSVSSSTVNYLHSGLDGNTTYYYRVVTVDQSGDVSAPAQAQARTLDTVSPEAVSDLTAAPGAGIGELVLAWTFPGDNGGAEPVTEGRWAIQHSTDSGVVWSTSSAQVQIATGAIAPSASRGWILEGLPDDVTSYVRVWSADARLNWSAPSNIAAAVSRQSSPVLSIIVPSDGSPNIRRDAPVRLTFSKTMRRADLLQALSVTKVRDRMAEDTADDVQGSLSPSSDALEYTFTPAARLDGNARYRIRVTTAARDIQGNAFGAESAAYFDTRFDPAERNVRRESNIRVAIPPGAVSGEGHIAVSTNAYNSVCERATRKMQAARGDDRRAPLPGCVADVSIIDGAGGERTGDFGEPVEVEMSFPD